ncbi:MAG TPA: SDR family oxidoreductase [Anaerolineales bacterium]|nr:SDR family oxidoreductase [Anaerolineales bacterium]
MKDRFTGKVALITGGSQGIGKGIALSLAEEGCSVVINYRSNLEEAQETAKAVESLGGKALICQADVADREAVRAMFDQAFDAFGRIDIVVANAAYSVREIVVEADWENVYRTLEVSQFGVFHTCQFAAQHMVEQPLTGMSRGKIVIISSILAEKAPPANAAYNMAKAAVNHLGETMAAELAESRINVNIINPGWIDTPGERKYATEEDLAAGAKRIPWKRLGTIDDIGKAVAYLASDDADYVTGATLRIDGGFLLGLQLPPVDDENRE